MKQSPIIPAEIYYYNKWRMHSIRMLVILTLLSNCIVWAFVAAFYRSAHASIWLAVTAVFFTFMASIKSREVTYYHEKFLRSSSDRSKTTKLISNHETKH